MQSRLSAAVPEDPMAVQEAETRRQPIYMALPRHPISRELDRLVREVAARGLRVAQAAAKTADVAAGAASRRRGTRSPGCTSA